ncbi:hypothetical protein [Amycolatopsis sp. DSM 110486]|uniref:hypothetical protein n=1 Tax=Amycolatopsis sp. DSM 110486 TaxID=2865832 RepID=UPI001C6A5642|nr:hypothetical protein [Amycolatopsis sp. DSM 110486]QYN17590.1 hypothetical protein K1T34_32920 [Amycolatopsis sp. DSM 110486]
MYISYLRANLRDVINEVNADNTPRPVFDSNTDKRVRALIVPPRLWRELTQKAQELEELKTRMRELEATAA